MPLPGELMNIKTSLHQWFSVPVLAPHCSQITSLLAESFMNELCSELQDSYIVFTTPDLLKVTGCLYLISELQKTFTSVRSFTHLHNIIASSICTVHLESIHIASSFQPYYSPIKLISSKFYTQRPIMTT